MTDTQKLVGHIASLLQAASNATIAATEISGILQIMQAAGREKLTEEEWARIDQRVADARADAVSAAG
jgi:pyrrolidone-carboxylate peptidase